MDIYKNIIKPILFSFDSELVHDSSIRLLELYSNFSGVSNPKKIHERTICGINFNNPIGLAAGFDKNARLIDVISKFGFGFTEIGTVTPKPQYGNPKPRMSRFEVNSSILNSIGFKNDGVKKIAQRLEKRKPSDLKIGGNIGKNKHTENSEAFRDYLICFEYLEDLVDYFTINISSPNTPNLRSLSETKYLTKILESLNEKNQKRQTPRPLFLKISPDMNIEQLEEIVRICEFMNLDGIVSSNTTTNHTYSYGGLSGQPLNEINSKLLKQLKSMSKKLHVISCGGIMNEEIAKDRLRDGADLIQIYTGLIYNGPNFPKKILNSF
jgi:dihydroorotate dehydrogenase